MAKRSNMAIENGWPRKVIIKRFQDRVYQMLDNNKWMASSYHFSTPLHSPDCCILESEMAFASVINKIKANKLDVFVSPVNEYTVKLFVIWPDS
jgi:hypothetical protein